MVASIPESWCAVKREEYFLSWVNQGMAIASVQTSKLVFPGACTDRQDSRVLELVHKQTQLASPVLD